MAFVIGDTQNTYSVIRLIDGEEAINKFCELDEFVLSMSEFDRQSRLNSKNPISTHEYLSHISKQIVPWTQYHKQQIVNAVDFLNSNGLDILKLCNLPKEICVVVTNGKDEAGAAYCRGQNIIVLPTNCENAWPSIFPHELFHIISKNNHELRDKLYECIGFRKIPNKQHVVLPKELTNLKITNPDAPNTYHYIKLQTKKQQNSEYIEEYLAPVLIASEQYDPEQNESFFSYLLTRFAVLDKETFEVVDLLSYDEVIGLYDKIGHNTDYIIHPEEILADNFVLLVTNSTEVESPEILLSMKEVLENTKQKNMEQSNKTINDAL